MSDARESAENTRKVLENTQKVLENTQKVLFGIQRLPEADLQQIGQKINCSTKEIREAMHNAINFSALVLLQEIQEVSVLAGCERVANAIATAANKAFIAP